MTPTRRRIVQALLYEAIAVACVGPVLGWVFDQQLASTTGLALFMSTVALVWNWAFNALFERWEARRPAAGRSFGRRLLHGLGFEGGLVLMLVPVMAAWLQVGLLEALLADLGVLAFFLVYAMAYTWAFDRIFGLPASAAPRTDR